MATKVSCKELPQKKVNQILMEDYRKTKLSIFCMLGLVVLCIIIFRPIFSFGLAHLISFSRIKLL